ncbi:caspase-3-like isoform X2 [Sycon ciliatum]
MTSKPRGTAYIINNKKFLTGLAERIGTDVDRDGLKKLWTYLGFKTEIFEDQGRADLIKRLQDLAKQDHSGRDCVIVSILTHGVEGKLYGSDGNLVPVNDLTELFNNGEAHRSLIGKPKLFFLQACCGGKQDEGVDVTDGPGCWPPVLARIASTTDIFVGYASSPGYESLRNIKRGSWFVQGIIKTFRDYSDKEHLLDMMTRVSKCIATEFETISAKKQQPTQVSQLTKKLYFRPGYYHGK